MTEPDKTSPSRSLAILHVASHAGVFRGGAVQLCRMALEQKRHGNRVTVAANMKRAFSDQERRDNRATWAHLTEVGISLLELDLETPAGLLDLRRAIRRGDFDIAHAHRNEALVAAWLASWRLRRPVLVAQRGTETPPSKWARRAIRSRRVRAVVAVAQAVKSELAQATGPSVAAKTHVVYGSVDLEAFSPRPLDAELRRELGLPQGARVVGSLSAWRLAKRLDRLLRILAAIMRDRPEVHAVFLGAGVKKRLEPLAAELGVSDRCHVVGHQYDVARWLSIMELTVVSADRREGLSGVLRESLAMGIPVVSTDCAGNGEIVRDGETGLLVPTGNAEALEAALRRALDDPPAMKAMAQAGRRWVVENCSTETQFTRIDTIYRSVLTR
ncbi:glycosyltransferase family 4 protein [Candidatus Sumerlaeota bacterium]|nr:glycosyltransferase family 4 protein [Candidatus Sumerlaeota bacterium]